MRYRLVCDGVNRWIPQRKLKWWPWWVNMCHWSVSRDRAELIIREEIADEAARATPPIDY